MHNALVTVGLPALIDGEGEVARAQQGGGVRVRLAREQRGQALRVRAGVEPQRASFGAVRDQDRHRAVTLRLHAERAPEFERGRERGDQRQRLGREAGDHRRVDPARYDNVGNVGAGAVEKGGRCRHRGKIGWLARIGHLLSAVSFQPSETADDHSTTSAD